MSGRILRKRKHVTYTEDAFQGTKVRKKFSRVDLYFADVIRFLEISFLPSSLLQLILEYVLFPEGTRLFKRGLPESRGILVSVECRKGRVRGHTGQTMIKYRMMILSSDLQRQQWESCKTKTDRKRVKAKLVLVVPHQRRKKGTRLTTATYTVFLQNKQEAWLIKS